MTYEEIEAGQRVYLPSRKKHGTVKDKGKVRIGGRDIERVYIDTDPPVNRVVCSPAVLRGA